MKMWDTPLDISMLKKATTYGLRRSSHDLYLVHVVEKHTHHDARKRTKREER